jgi:hypothetical protein
VVEREIDLRERKAREREVVIETGVDQRLQLIGENLYILANLLGSRISIAFSAAKTEGCRMPRALSWSPWRRQRSF